MPRFPSFQTKETVFLAPFPLFLWFYLLFLSTVVVAVTTATARSCGSQAVLTGVVRVAVGSKRRGICIAAIGYAYPVVSPTRLLAAVLRRTLQTTVVIATIAATATVLRSRRTRTRRRTAASTAVVSALTAVPEQPSQQVATVITAATARSIYVITHSILIPSCAFKTSVLYYIVCNK